MDRTQVKKLLDFRFKPDRVFGFANAGFNRANYDKNIERLTEISDAMYGVRDILPEEEIGLLIKRLHELWKNGVPSKEVKVSLLEARSVGFGLEVATEPEFVVFLHKTLERPGNWTPSCLKGFLHSTLRLWSQIDPAVREANSAFISRHSKSLDGEIAAVAPYISADGPTRLGLAASKQKKSYLGMTSAVLMPASRLNYTYFGDALIAYFQDLEERTLDDLRSALNLHNQSRTDKVLLPMLIVKARDFNKELLDIATKRIGDPFDEPKWAPFEGATSKQKEELIRARRILLGWIMQEIIRAFFDVLCNDRERKNFWIQHAHQVTDFSVFGSNWSKQMVMGRLPSQSVIKHFKTVDSTVDNCALAMYIGEYVIIEFTQVGALYAYKVGGKNYRQAFRHSDHLTKIDDLKVPNLSLLYDLDYHRFAREGKMDHRGSWAYRMNNWIDHQVAPTINESDNPKG